MPNGVSTDQWFLEVNGKKFGPYTMAQINALVRHHEIVGEDKVTASHLSGKWITVQEFVSKGDPAASAALSAGPSPQRSAQSIPQGAPATVPPRPDERTLTSITAPVSHSNEPRKSGSDAVLNLFEILQAARERKTPTPTAAAAQPVIEMPRPVKSSSGAGIFWIAVPAMITLAVAAWRMTSSPPPAAVAETETPAKAPAQKSAPVAASAPAAQKPAQSRTVAAAVPPAKSKPVTHAPGFSVGRQALKQAPAPTVSDRERDRERERELEREAERELEREKERDAEYARSSAPADSRGYDRDRERERERESERDHRDHASDRGLSSNDRYDRYDRATASAGGPDALPVTGGIPADPGAFRDPAGAGSEGEGTSGFSPPAAQ